MIKIFFYIDVLLVGGIEKVLIELLKNLNKEKFEITLVIGYKLYELEKLITDVPENVKIKYIFQENIFVSYKKKKVQGKLKKIEKILFESQSWLRKKILKYKLKKIIDKDSILVDYDMTLAPIISNFSIFKITFCHFSLKNYNRGIERRQKRLGKRLNFYDNIFVISDEMKKEALQMYPFLSDKLIRMYNSFNIDDIKQKANSYSVSNHEKYILSIGRLEETQKDFKTLIKAYASIEKDIDMKLYIIGDGRYREALEEQVKFLNLSDKIIFLGFIKNPYPYIKNASLFVHSSKFEGLPTVLIEALLLEKIIIATNCPTGPKEILNYGKNGILVDIGDYKTMAYYMREILLKKINITDYLKNSKEWSKEFDCHAILQKFEKYIENSYKIRKGL